MAMLSTSVVPEAFSTPGWQIEKKYSTKVLLGNWVEERGKVRRKSQWENSSEKAIAILKCEVCLV
jgi:hypothetical protein